MQKISFVIPCYHSETTIATVTNEIIETVTARGGYDYEIILVNDSSPDRVYDVICSLAAENPRIKGVDLSKNFGQHAAIMAGMRYVTGDILVCLDDDGQTPASQMFSLIDKLDENDLVFAEYKNKKHSLFRNLGSKVNDKMTRWLLDKPKDLKIMSYFACKRFIVDEVLRYENSYPYISGLLLRSTKKVSNVVIEHKERIDGRSGYTFKKLIKLWVNGFTAFSVKPLRIATVLGMLVALLGFGYGVFTVVRKIVNPSIMLGYSSLMAVMLFLGGLIMLMLGMIGEYVGRIYISINRSPQYVIRQTKNLEETNKDEK